MNRTTGTFYDKDSKYYNHRKTYNHSYGSNWDKENNSAIERGIGSEYNYNDKKCAPKNFKKKLDISPRLMEGNLPGGGSSVGGGPGSRISNRTGKSVISRISANDRRSNLDRISILSESKKDDDIISHYTKSVDDRRSYGAFNADNEV
jgi:hypothetical protein